MKTLLLRPLKVTTMAQLSIAQKNDHMRQTMTGCRIFLASGVEYSDSRDAIILAARVFYQFTDDSNPYGENDFSFFDVNGKKYFFKFDYYDDSFEFFQEDGNRVLTIGRADEY